MFLLATKVAVYQKVVSNVEEVKARGGRVLAVVTEGDSGLAKLADHKIEVPETLDLLTPVLTVLPLQLLAYRSEEHTSELQSHSDLVCRLLLEKKQRMEPREE